MKRLNSAVAFAMALLPNPQVLFLDEPFEAIDPVTSKIMRNMLVSIARRGVTARHYIRRPDSALIAAADKVATRIAAALNGPKLPAGAGEGRAA